MFPTRFLLFNSFVILCGGFILSSRDYSKILRVPNGGQYGYWSQAEFCPLGTYASGYSLKIEPNQFFGDDTALNAIRLLCSDKQGHRNITHQISSVQGPYGSWSKEEVCLQSYDVSSFLTAFQLQVEPPQGAGDDTMANFVHFKCRPFGDDPALNETILTLAPGHGSWGTWSNWTESCDANEAICGIQTKVEQVQGSDDDTALNDVVFYCCE
ncbi:Vitelline membrane outer layer protein 1 [Mactra antiquata]